MSHYKVKCSECATVIRQCRCPGGEVTYDTCKGCKKDILDSPAPSKECCRDAYWKGFHKMASAERLFSEGQKQAARKFIELYRDTPLHGSECQPCQIFLDHCEEKVMEALMPDRLN